MNQPQIQYQSVLKDLGELVDNYERAGLLQESGSNAPAREILGEREQIRVFRRTLLFTFGLLRNYVWKEVMGDSHRLSQIPVFGGTKTGKSTVTNVLVGLTVAAEHHVGGFTRHAQGFSPPGTNG